MYLRSAVLPRSWGTVRRPKLLLPLTASHFLVLGALGTHSPHHVFLPKTFCPPPPPPAVCAHGPPKSSESGRGKTTKDKHLVGLSQDWVGLKMSFSCFFVRPSLLKSTNIPTESPENPGTSLRNCVYAVLLRFGGFLRSPQKALHGEGIRREIPLPRRLLEGW